ncbi:hypothetical protein HDV04_000435 [Boothiomyces sp. JEL0838]|nr:hypothetical protein HDV04_000435 [Boothiomyces sp. JEL0838]
MNLKSFILTKETQPQFQQFTANITDYRQFLSDLKESFLINDQSQETKLFFTLELYKTIKVYKNDFDLVLDLLYLFYHDNQHILKGISFIISLFRMQDFNLILDYEKTIITGLLTTKSTVLYIFISNLLSELCKISDYGSVLKRLKKELKTTRFDLILRTEFNPKKYRELRNRVLSSEITYFNSLYKQIESCDYELDPHDLKLFIQASLILNGKLANSPYDKVINSIINYLKRNNIIDMPIYDILPTRWKIQYMEPENVDDLMDSEGLDLYLCCDYVLRMAKKRKVLAIKEKKKITDFINKKPIYYQ